MAASMSRDDVPSRFAEEARAAGLRLPEPRRFRLSWTLAILAVVVGASLGVGYTVGWLNPILPVHPTPQLQGSQDCGSAAVPLVVDTESNQSSSLAPAWSSLASAFAAATGGCVDVSTSGSSFGALASLSADGLVGPELPSAAAGVSLPSSTLSIPLLVSPVVVLVNLGPSVSALNLSAAALAGFYQGTLTSWNVDLVTAVNPGLHSSLGVTPLTLGGSTPTDRALCHYLSEWNSSFRSGVSCSSAVAWPAGRPVASPAALISTVAATPGALGFVPNAVCGSLPSGVLCAALQTGGSAPAYSLPTATSVALAASQLANSSAAASSDWANVTGVALTNSSAYPMVELTYGVVYADLGTVYGPSLTLGQAKWLMTLLWWVTIDSGATASGFGYFPLPPALVAPAETLLVKVAYQGASVLEPPGEENGESGGETGEF